MQTLILMLGQFKDYGDEFLHQAFMFRHLAIFDCRIAEYPFIEPIKSGGIPLTQRGSNILWP